MGNLKTSQTGYLCCCRNEENSSLPQNFADIKAYEQESNENTLKEKKENIEARAFKDSNRSILHSQDFMYLQRDQKSMATLFNSTEFSLNDEQSTPKSSRIDAITFLNRIIKLQRLIKQKYNRNSSTDQSLCSSNCSKSSRRSIGNYSQFLKQILEISKQPALYNEEEQQKTHVRATSAIIACPILNKLNGNFSTRDLINRRKSESTLNFARKNNMRGGKSSKLFKLRSKNEIITNCIKILKGVSISIDDSHKFGLKLYNNGSRLVGFFDDRCHIDGIGYYESEGNASYKGKQPFKVFIFLGEFQQNEFSGFGYTLNKSENPNSSNYLGCWKSNTEEGIGIEIWSNGSFYKGEFFRSKKHGVGTYFWANGASYLGEWSENKMDGHVS